MDENKQNNKKRDAVNATRVKRVAEITGVSDRHVRRVINGDSQNEEVLSTYMFLAEGENALVHAAKKLLPF